MSVTPSSYGEEVRSNNNRESTTSKIRYTRRYTALATGTFGTLLYASGSARVSPSPVIRSVIALSARLVCECYFFGICCIRWYFLIGVQIMSHVRLINAVDINETAYHAQNRSTRRSEEIWIVIQCAFPGKSWSTELERINPRDLDVPRYVRG